MVVPNHQLAAAGGGGTWTGDVVVNGDVTGKELVDKVRDALIKIGRRKAAARSEGTHRRPEHPMIRACSATGHFRPRR